MDINTTSRIFIDVASKLLILSKAKRVGKGTYTVGELLELSKEKDKEGYCVMLKPRDVGGYVLACGGQLIAIALLNPPSIGKKALENVDENPMFGDLYVVPKDAVKEALRKLKAEEVVSGVGEQVGKAIQIVKDKLMAKQRKEEEEKAKEMLEEIEIPKSMTEIPKLEIFDMIDAVTLADELAYYLSKKGYQVSSDTPEMVGNTFFVTLRVENVPDMKKFINDLLEEAKRVGCENIVKVNMGSEEIFVDPVLFEKICNIIKNLTRGGYCYMETHAPDEVILKINLDEEISARGLALLRAHVRKMIEQRQLPWRKVIISVSTPTTTYHEA